MWEEVERKHQLTGPEGFPSPEICCFVLFSTTRFFKERRLVHMNMNKSLDEGFLKMFYAPHLQLQNKKSTRHPLHFTSKSWFPPKTCLWCDFYCLYAPVQVTTYWSSGSNQQKPITLGSWSSTRLDTFFILQDTSAKPQSQITQSTQQDTPWYHFQNISAVQISPPGRHRDTKTCFSNRF